MDEAATIMVSLGGILLAGLATDTLGQKTKLPRVTLLLVFGFAIGPGGLNLIPAVFRDSFDLVASMALVMVGFLLGGQFTARALRRHGRSILWISIMTVLVTSVFVGVTLGLLGHSLVIALLLAGIAPATDPAATMDVVHESKSRGEFPQTLLGIVAIDDAWGLLVFSLCASAATLVSGSGVEGMTLLSAGWEIGGAVLLGIALGLPTAYISGRVRKGEPTLTEALGIVFLCGGLALRLEVSFLIAPMVMGAVVTNLARHHRRPFHAIEDIEWPFMVLFFVLAGASFEWTALGSVWGLILLYIVSRGCGRVAGGWLGGYLGGTDKTTRRWVGVALMPQAGVALGMAMVAAGRLPEVRETLVPIVVSSTIVFELIGPILTGFALQRVNRASSTAAES